MRIYHWICSAAVAAMILAGSHEPGLAQQAPSPTIAIKTTQPQSVSRNISDIFDGRVPATISLRFTVERPGWWFIRFETIPSGVELLGEPSASGSDGEVRSGHWYAFQRPFTLTVLVEPTATSPVSLRYLLGRAAEGQRPPGNTQPAPSIVQRGDIRIAGKEQYVKLFWPTEQPIIKTNPTAMKILVYENTYFEPHDLSIEGDAAGWSFFRLRGIPDYLRVRLTESSSPDVLTLAPGSELVNGQWYGFKQIAKLEISLREMISSTREVKLAIESGEAAMDSDARAAATAALSRNEIVPHGGEVAVSLVLEPPTLTGVAKRFWESPLWRFLVWISLAAILGIVVRRGWRYYQTRKTQHVIADGPPSEEAEQPVERVLADSVANDTQTSGWWSRVQKLLPFAPVDRAATEEPRVSELVKRIQSPTTAARKSPFPPPEMISVPDISAEVAQSVQLHTRQLRQIEQKVAALEGLVLNSDKTKERVDDIEQRRKGWTPPSSEGDLQEQIAAKLKDLEDTLRTDVKKQSRLLSAQIEGLEQTVSQLSDKIREQEAHTDENRRLLEDYAHQLRQMGSTPPPAAEPKADVSAPTRDTQDRLYARLLGLIFAGNIDGLEKEGFDAAIRRAGETLNRFFQEELPLAHELQDLSLRVKDMIAALEAIASKGSAVKKETYGDLRLAAERARRLGQEITSLQSHLQNRELELDLHIRVSASAGGHAIFLEELGRAVKQAIDKFTDPQAYMERRLDRFVTEDVIAVADLCDREIAPPGEDDELERLLKELFRAAELKPILPISMEPFQPVEHHIVELVPGGRSQAVARVIGRGFYYKDQILRKADVAVYK